jgi:uncharacterized protein (TIGR03435 family)
MVVGLGTTPFLCAALEGQTSVGQEAKGGMIDAKPQRFETVSIRPVPEDSSGLLQEAQGVEFRVHAMPLAVLVQMAFGINPNQMIVPSWTQEAKFDIVAKTGVETRLTREEIRPLLQAMLTERFGMQYHRETREIRGYEMTAAKGGLKLTPATPGAAKGGGGGPTLISMPSATMQALADMLAARVGLPVKDKTGAEGDYQVELHFAREDDPDPMLPSISVALNDTMGLKLVPAKLPVQMVVIDSLSRKPTEN